VKILLKTRKTVSRLPLDAMLDIVKCLWRYLPYW